VRTLSVSPPTPRLNEVVTTGVPPEVVVVVVDIAVVAPLEEVEGEVVVDTPLTLLIGKKIFIFDVGILKHDIVCRMETFLGMNNFSC
jgi:hypothetical protein